MTPTFAFALPEGGTNPQAAEVTEQDLAAPSTEANQNDGTDGATQSGGIDGTSAEPNETTATPDKVLIEEREADSLSSELLQIANEYNWPAFTSGAARQEDLSQYTPTMKIYAIYMHRASGARNSSDRYGDAVLIESNGKYLLMDTGTWSPIKNSNDVHTSSLVSTLNKIGVSELDVYISHMHGDHIRGLQGVADAFTINKLYLPDIGLCAAYETPTYNKDIGAIYKGVLNTAVKEKSEVVFLAPSFKKHYAPKTYDMFTVGAVRFDVKGPAGSYKVSDFVKQDGKTGTKEGHYLNNCSLATIATCGNFRYLSLGDTEYQGEEALVKKYGYGLNCNLMKLSHHGLDTSNKSTILSRVTPTWSFTTNHGYVSSASISRAGDYGFNYVVATSKYSIIYDISYDSTRMYIDYNRNDLPDDGLVKGWLNSKGRYQYYDGAGHMRTGWNRLSGSNYFMSGTTGFRTTGTVKINGVKCKFKSSGKLYDPKKPYKPSSKPLQAKSNQLIKVRWSKASRSSRYQVYRSTAKNGSYTLVATLSNKSRSFTDKGLTKGSKYYYKVRGIRYIAGTTLYGSFSKARSARAK